LWGSADLYPIGEGYAVLFFDSPSLSVDDAISVSHSAVLTHENVKSACLEVGLKTRLGVWRICKRGKLHVVERKINDPHKCFLTLNASPSTRLTRYGAET